MNFFAGIDGGTTNLSITFRNPEKNHYDVFKINAKVIDGRYYVFMKNSFKVLRLRVPEIIQLLHPFFLQTKACAIEQLNVIPHFDPKTKTMVVHTNREVLEFCVLIEKHIQDTYKHCSVFLADPIKVREMFEIPSHKDHPVRKMYSQIYFRGMYGDETTSDFQEAFTKSVDGVESLLLSIYAELRYEHELEQNKRRAILAALSSEPTKVSCVERFSFTSNIPLMEAMRRGRAELTRTLAELPAGVKPKLPRKKSKKPQKVQKTSTARRPSKKRKKQQEEEEDLEEEEFQV